ncbi:MAG: MATE family efflux transporter [Clostridiales bacterium]|nr:MATE family efflux transporter [Clostridiales bacterium]
MKTITTRAGLVSRLYWRLLPVLILSCVVISANAFIDSVFAGRFLGTQAMALIGLFGPVSTLFSGLASVFATGAQQLCCSEMGDGNSRRLRQIFNAGLMFLLGSGIFCGVLLFLFRRELAAGLGTRGTMQAELSAYMVGISLGIVGQLLSCYLMPFLQINGHNRLSYLAMAVNLVGNMGFNTLFVAVLSWGLLGMGLATSLSSLFCVGVMLPVFCQKKELAHFDPHGLKVRDLVDIARIGSPVLMFHAGLFIKNYGMNCALLNGSIMDSVAVLTLQGSLCGILGALGFSSGTVVQMLSSFFIGEGDRKSVLEVFAVSMKNGLSLCILAILLLLSCSMPILRLFGLEGGATQAMALRMLRMLCLAILLNLVLTVLVKLLQAAEKLALANAITFLENAFQGVFALLFVGKLGPDAAWAANSVATALCLLVVMVYGLSGGADCWRDPLRFLHFPTDFGSAVDARMTLTICSQELVMDAARGLMEFCKRQGMSERACMTAGVCVEELAGNVVKHGFQNQKSGTVWVLATIQNKTLTLRIRDNCIRFDPKEYLRLSVQDYTSEHIGIRLVAGLAESVEYKNMFGMNMLTIEVKT